MNKDRWISRARKLLKHVADANRRRNGVCPECSAGVAEPCYQGCNLNEIRELLRHKHEDLAS